jgi:hypothetical protein
MSPTPPQLVYIVTAIHCPSPEGVNPHCYTITGAYNSSSAAQKAMLAKAKELYSSPVTHWHGIKLEAKVEPEWKESEYKVEFKGKEGDFGVCWVDERVLGVEEVPITGNLRRGRFGMRGKEESEMDDLEDEKTLGSLLRF